MKKLCDVCYSEFDVYELRIETRDQWLRATYSNSITFNWSQTKHQAITNCIRYIVSALTNLITFVVKSLRSFEFYNDRILVLENQLKIVLKMQNNFND